LRKLTVQLFDYIFLGLLNSVNISEFLTLLICAFLVKC